MLARCSGAALVGLDAVEVAVEVDITPGLPGVLMVGLADAAVQESRERVRSALRNSGLRMPLTRVVVNLAPADVRKEGPAFDLPIALALLLASDQLDHGWRCATIRSDWLAGLAVGHQINAPEHTETTYISHHGVPLLHIAKGWAYHVLTNRSCVFNDAFFLHGIDRGHDRSCCQWVP